MDDGLYKADFSGPAGSGNGVVALHGDKFSGGDSVIAYVGTLEQRGDQLRANLQTFRHSNGGISVFGKDSVNVSLRGVTTTGGATLNAVGINFTVALTRIAA